MSITARVASSMRHRLRSGAASFSTEGLSVSHDEKGKQFYVKIGDDKAVLDYDFIGDKKVDLYHTEVPTVFRGKGVAQLLAQSAMDFVVAKDLRMKLSCTYLQKYIKDNPKEDYTKRLL